MFYYAYIWRARGEGRRRRIEDDVGSRVGPRFRWRRRRKRVDEAGGRDRRSRAAVPLQQPPPPPLPPTPVPRVQLSQTLHAPDAKGDICLDRARQRPPPSPDLTPSRSRVGGAGGRGPSSRGRISSTIMPTVDTTNSRSVKTIDSLPRDPIRPRPTIIIIIKRVPKTGGRSTSNPPRTAGPGRGCTRSSRGTDT